MVKLKSKISFFMPTVAMVQEHMQKVAIQHGDTQRVRHEMTYRWARRESAKIHYRRQHAA